MVVFLMKHGADPSSLDIEGTVSTAKTAYSGLKNILRHFKCFIKGKITECILIVLSIRPGNYWSSSGYLR